MPLGMEEGLSPRDLLCSMVTHLPHKKSTAPPILAHVYCGQTAGWTKTPLGTEVDFWPRHIVLDGDPASPRKGTAAPSFRPMFTVAVVAHLSYTAELLFRFHSTSGAVVGLVLFCST